MDAEDHSVSFQDIILHLDKKEYPEGAIPSKKRAIRKRSSGTKMGYSLKIPCLIAVFVSSACVSLSKGNLDACHHEVHHCLTTYLNKGMQNDNGLFDCEAWAGFFKCKLGVKNCAHEVNSARFKITYSFAVMLKNICPNIVTDMKTFSTPVQAFVKKISESEVKDLQSSTQCGNKIIRHSVLKWIKLVKESTPCQDTFYKSIDFFNNEVKDQDCRANSVKAFLNIVNRNFDDLVKFDC